MGNVIHGFTACEICGTNDWRLVYSGPIRDGSFGSQCAGAKVAECGGCGVHRLDEASCLDPHAYESGDYRKHLSQGTELETYFSIHDGLQIFALDAIRPRSLRGLTIADVGCGGGSFLDHVRGVAGRIIAIEPADHYLVTLEDRGYEVYPYVSNAASALGTDLVDMAVSFQVIEHVIDPRHFLAEIRNLVKPDGILVLSTPNRGDILLDLLPDEFPAFFYRVAHRWYFDAESLAACAKRAGFAVREIRYIHRYGMANALQWLRDRQPQGQSEMPGIDKMADGFWKSYLESTGRSDNLLTILEPES